ncbi:MAG: hypothetical protein QXZ60_04360 [Sulfolobales archaeon]
MVQLGLNAIQIAKVLGAKVATIDIRDEKPKLAKEVSAYYLT